MTENDQQQAELVGLITRHQVALRAYITSLMPGMSGVSDVLQETNIVLWKKWKKFEPGSNFIAWAFSIARFEVKAHRRKSMKLGWVGLDEELVEDLAEYSAMDESLSENHLQALDHCLRSLKDDERKLLEHRYFSKKSLSDFSTPSGRSAESLRVTLFRVRAALRKCINQRLEALQTES